MHPVSKTNTHHGVIIDLVNHGMFKNTNTWLSWEWYITFLWNKKILNLCLRWHILRNYHFLAEVTFKNWMQKNRWKTEAIKNRLLLLLLFTVYIIDVSNKLNKNLSVISLELIGILTFLLCLSSDMDTNPSFMTWFKLYTPISNLKLKWMAFYLILSPLREKFARDAYFLYFYTLLQLRYLPVSLMPIKD